MRLSVALIVVVGLFACSQADVLDTLKETGKNLVTGLVNKGKELLTSE